MKPLINRESYGDYAELVFAIACRWIPSRGSGLFQGYDVCDTVDRAGLEVVYFNGATFVNFWTYRNHLHVIRERTSITTMIATIRAIASISITWRQSYSSVRAQV